MFLDLHRGVLEEFAERSGHGLTSDCLTHLTIHERETPDAVRERVASWRALNGQRKRQQNADHYARIKADPVRYGAMVRRQLELRKLRKAGVR